MEEQRHIPRGRWSHLEPPNRFGGTFRILDLDQVNPDDEDLPGLLDPRTEYLSDRSRSIISENSSPDIPFRYSLNPYRGCQHGCSYCFARPTHEYLGYNAGLDFETKILVKHEAPALFRAFLSRKSWKPEPIAMAPITDAYQPGERQFEITRGCLQVAAEFSQPMSLITKNALILRDIDILAKMAVERLVSVYISITTLNQELSKTMEPRASAPAARLRAIRALADAGVPVGVFVAPIIPGLNDSEIPAILAAARKAGASSSGYVILRLPLTVVPVFLEWLHRCRPERAAKVESRLRGMRDGSLNRSQFGERMSGTGPMAEQISRLFRLMARKHGLDGRLPSLDTTRFRRSKSTDGQLWLF